MAIIIGTDKVEFLDGTSDDDTIYGTEFSEIISGWGGNDVIFGGAGVDFLSGDGGDDVITGGPGDDFINGYSYEGYDTAVYSGNVADYSISDDPYRREGITITDLRDGSPDGVDQFAFIDRLLFADTSIETKDIQYTVQLQLGGSPVYGSILRDIITGSSGEDWFDVQNGGNDVLDGGAGMDRILLYGDSSFYSFEMTGDAGVVVYNPTSSITFKNIETLTWSGRNVRIGQTVTGNSGSDNLTGGYGNDVLRGANGDDVLIGNEGNDQLYSGAGNDTINAGTGNDVIDGGAGKDIMTTGLGQDIIKFAPGDSLAGGGVRDVVTDFQKGVDKIDLTAFGHIDYATQISTVKIGSGLIVYVDVNNNGFDYSDFGVQLTGISSIANSDLILV